MAQTRVYPDLGGNNRNGVEITSPNLLSNPKFEDISGWYNVQLDTFSVVGDGYARLLITAPAIRILGQGLQLEAGEVYEVEFTLSDYSGGGTGARFRINSGAINGTLRTADGTYTEQFTAPTSWTVFELVATSGLNPCSFSDVKLYKVL